MFPSHDRSASGTNQDITPIRATANLVNAFTTTNTTANITITDTNHGATLGDFVTISSSSTAVGGIPAATLDAEYEILSITNVDAYIISSNATATSTAGPTGNCSVSYQLNVGPSVQTFGFGWGSGAWNTGAWNTPRTTSQITLDARLWSINNWGEDLIITQKDGERS